MLLLTFLTPGAFTNNPLLSLLIHLIPLFTLLSSTFESVFHFPLVTFTLSFLFQLLTHTWKGYTINYYYSCVAKFEKLLNTNFPGGSIRWSPRSPDLDILPVFSWELEDKGKKVKTFSKMDTQSVFPFTTYRTGKWQKMDKGLKSISVKIFTGKRTGLWIT